MKKSSSELPSWLSKANDISHMTTVYRVLADRENQRQNVRDAPVVSAGSTTEHTHSFRSGLMRMLESNKTRNYSTAIAQLPENRRRNRYYDIQPYDRGLVVYDASEEGKKDGGEDHSVYINANWVLERFGHKWWIAMQAPLPNTAHTVLSLFLQPILCPPLSLSSNSKRRMTQLRTIVQLTKNFDGGRRKAHPYFPSEVGKSKLLVSDDSRSTMGLKTTLLHSRTIKKARCLHSTVSLVPILLNHKPRQSYDSQDSRFSEHDDEGEDGRDWGEESGEAVVFHHFLYKSWPDHGVPHEDDEQSLLLFTKLVDSTNRNTAPSKSGSTEPDPDPPIVVGCSAGVGRTGSFIALSSLLRMYDYLPPASSPSPSTDIPKSPLGSLPRSVRDDLVALEVDSLREQRPSMVQRDEQLKLIYVMLSAAIVSNSE